MRSFASLVVLALAVRVAEAGDKRVVKCTVGKATTLFQDTTGDPVPIDLAATPKAFVAASFVRDKGIRIQTFDARGKLKSTRMVGTKDVGFPSISSDGERVFIVWAAGSLSDPTEIWATVLGQEGAELTPPTKVVAPTGADQIRAWGARIGAAWSNGTGVIMWWDRSDTLRMQKVDEKLAADSKPEVFVTEPQAKSAPVKVVKTADEIGAAWWLPDGKSDNELIDLVVAWKTKGKPLKIESRQIFASPKPDGNGANLAFRSGKNRYPFFTTARFLNAIDVSASVKSPPSAKGLAEYPESWSVASAGDKGMYVVADKKKFWVGIAGAGWGDDIESKAPVVLPTSGSDIRFPRATSPDGLVGLITWYERGSKTSTGRAAVLSCK